MDTTRNQCNGTGTSGQGVSPAPELDASHPFVKQLRQQLWESENGRQAALQEVETLKQTVERLQVELAEARRNLTKDVDETETPYSSWQKAKQLGNTEFKQGDFRAAKTHYLQAIQLHEKSCSSKEGLDILHANMAQCCLKLNEADIGLWHCERSLVLNPENYKALYRRALAKNMQHETFAALEDLKHLCKLDPDNSEAKSKATEIGVKLESIRKEYTDPILRIALQKTIVGSTPSLANVALPALGIEIQDSTQDFTDHNISFFHNSQQALTLGQQHHAELFRIASTLMQANEQQVLEDVDLAQVDAMLFDVLEAETAGVSALQSLLECLPLMEQEGRNLFKYLLVGYAGPPIRIVFEERMKVCKCIISAIAAKKMEGASLRAFVQALLRTLFVPYCGNIGDPFTISTAFLRKTTAGIDLPELIECYRLFEALFVDAAWSNIAVNCFISILNFDPECSQSLGLDASCLMLHSQTTMGDKLNNMSKILFRIREPGGLNSWLQEYVPICISIFALELCVLSPRLAELVFDYVQQVDVLKVHQIKFGHPLPALSLRQDVGTLLANTSVMLIQVVVYRARGANYLIAKRPKKCQLSIGPGYEYIGADGAWYPCEITQLSNDDTLHISYPANDGGPPLSQSVHKSVIRKQQQSATPQSVLKAAMLMDEGPFRKGEKVTVTSRRFDLARRGEDFEFSNADGKKHWIYADLNGRYFQLESSGVDSAWVWADLEGVVFDSEPLTGGSPRVLRSGKQDATVYLRLLIEVASSLSIELTSERTAVASNLELPDYALEEFATMAEQIIGNIKTLARTLPPRNFHMAYDTPVDVVRQLLQFQSEWHEVMPIRQKLELLKRLCSVLHRTHGEGGALEVSRRLVQMLQHPLRGHLVDDFETFCQKVAQAVQADAELFDAAGVHIIFLEPEQLAMLQRAHQSSPELTRLLAGLVSHRGSLSTVELSHIIDFNSRLKALIDVASLQLNQHKIDIVAPLLLSPHLMALTITQMSSIETWKSAKEMLRKSVNIRNKGEVDLKDTFLQQERLDVWNSFLQVLKQHPEWCSVPIVTSLVSCGLITRMNKWISKIERVFAGMGAIIRSVLVDLLHTARIGRADDVDAVLSALDEICDFIASWLGLQASRANLNTIPLDFKELLSTIFSCWPTQEILRSEIIPVLTETCQKLIELESCEASARVSQVLKSLQINVCLKRVVQLSLNEINGSDEELARTSLRRSSDALLSFYNVVMSSWQLSATVGSQSDVVKLVLVYLPIYSHQLWSNAKGVEIASDLLKRVRSKAEYEAASMVLQRASSYDRLDEAKSFLVSLWQCGSVIRMLDQAVEHGDDELLHVLRYCHLFRVKSGMDFCWRRVQDFMVGSSNCNEVVSARAAFACLSFVGCDVPLPVVQHVLQQRIPWNLLFQCRFQAASSVQVAEVGAMMANQLRLLHQEMTSTFSGTHSDQAFVDRVATMLFVMQELKNTSVSCNSSIEISDTCFLASLCKTTKAILGWSVGLERDSTEKRVEHACLALAQGLSSFVASFSGKLASACQLLLASCIRMGSSWEDVRFTSDYANALPLVKIAPTPTELSKKEDFITHLITRPRSLEQSPWMVARSTMLKMTCWQKEDQQSESPISDFESSIIDALSGRFISNMHSSTRFVPLPALYPKRTVLFRGLGDRDGKNRSVQSVVDLLTCGMAASDLSKSNPFGQTSSKSGQIFCTHMLHNTAFPHSGAFFYLTKNFSDGALIALDSEYANQTMLRGDYRFQIEGVLHLVLYQQIPLTAVVAIFMPDRFAHDIRLIYESDEAAPSFILPEFQTLTSMQICLAREALRSNEAGSADPFFERAITFLPASDEGSCWKSGGKGLVEFVTRTLTSTGWKVLEDSGLTLLTKALVDSERSWASCGSQVAAELAQQLPADLIPSVLPNADRMGLSRWLRELASTSDDSHFAKMFPLMEPFLPALVRLQDLVPQKFRMAHLSSQQNLTDTDVSAQAKTLPSLLQVVRRIFSVSLHANDTRIPFLCTDDLVEVVQPQCSEEMLALRLLARVSGLLVMLPELLKHLRDELREVSVQSLQDRLIRNIASAFWVSEDACNECFSRTMLSIMTAYMESFWRLRAGPSSFVLFWTNLRLAGAHTQRNHFENRFQICKRRLWAVVWRLLWARVAAVASSPHPLLQLRQDLIDADAFSQVWEISEKAARDLALTAHLYLDETALSGQA